MFGVLWFVILELFYLGGLEQVPWLSLQRKILTIPLILDRIVDLNEKQQVFYVQQVFSDGTFIEKNGSF